VQTAAAECSSGRSQQASYEGRTNQLHSPCYVAIFQTGGGPALCVKDLQICGAPDRKVVIPWGQRLASHPLYVLRHTESTMEEDADSGEGGPCVSCHKGHSEVRLYGLMMALKDHKLCHTLCFVRYTSGFKVQQYQTSSLDHAV